MKRYLIYIMSVLAALSALTACDREELRNDLLGESLSVRLGVETRAGLSSASQIGDFGLFIYDKANVKMSTTDHASWSPATAILWAQTPVTYWAYYPYDASVAASGGYTTVNCSVKADQSSENDVVASDYLAASATVSARPAGGVLPIELKHVMSKIVINLTLSGDLQGGTVSDMTLNKSYTSAILYLHDESSTYADCQVVANNASGAASSSIKMNGSAGAYEAIVVPQQFVPSVSFTVTVGGNDYDYEWTPSAMTFAQGKRYTVNMTADRSVLSVGGINVSDWETGTLGSTTTTTESKRKAISNLAELVAFRDAVNAGTVDATNEYYLTNNITVTSDWGKTGVGTSEKPFNGILDGNGKTITISRTMSYTSGSTIYYHGGVFDYVGTTGKVYNLTVSGSISQTYTGNVNGTKTAYTGGIVGQNNGVVEGCIYDGTVMTSVTNMYKSNSGSAYSYSGGIAGSNNGIIQVCGVPYSVTGDIATNATVNKSYNGYAYSLCGGIAGYNALGSKVLACYNHRNVAASYSSNRGGMSRCGIVSYNDGNVDRSYYYFGSYYINANKNTPISVTGLGHGNTSNSTYFSNAYAQFNNDNINYMNAATENSLYKWVRNTSSSPYDPTISKK